MIILFACCYLFVIMAKKGNKKTQQQQQQQENNVQNETVDITRAEFDQLKKRVKDLENRCEKLEAAKAVSEQVTEVLRKEIDRLDQYGRRHNVVIRNVELPANESQKQVEETVGKIVEKSLKAPALMRDVDKMHRIGRIKKTQGKNFQNIVVRFRTHRSRYELYGKRKDLKNGIKIGPHLTHHRGKVLHESIEHVQDIPGVEFTFANLHGDLAVKLSEKYEGKDVFSFNTIDELNAILLEKGLIEEDEDEAEE